MRSLLGHPLALCKSRTMVTTKHKLHRRCHMGTEKRDRLRTSPERESQLGRFGSENHMPFWLRQYLLTHGQNTKAGIIQLLRDVLNDSSDTISAYLCHPSVHRISKLRFEGSFCGYRNIQMLISHIMLAMETEPPTFPDGMPNIFQLQDQIEEAWDNGHNARGRIETGGIKGTRKFIGTLEAQALLLHLNIKCSALRFQDSRETSALDQLSNVIETYFRRSLVKIDTGEQVKVQVTELPPVYLQRPGHSLTVVGLEKTVNGDLHLIVFNPGRHYRDTIYPFSLLSNRRKRDILETYRLRLDALRNYSEFELLL